MRRLVFIFSLFLSQALSAATIENEKISIMGLVAGHAITSRQVLTDIILEFPKKVSARGLDWIDEKEMARGFERCVTQRMIIEDLKIVGDASTAVPQVNSRYSQFRKELGTVQYQKVYKSLELTDALMRERLSQKIQVERAIEEKVTLALNTRMEKLGLDEKAKVSQKAIEDWLAQLKARYRVQVFRKND